jgi:LAO/AO transport system kinase
MAGDNLSKLLKTAKTAGDGLQLARALSIIDKNPVGAVKCKELLEAKPSFRIGITGPPGAGKSTLVSKLVAQFRSRELSVGVLAVDPSSPISRGAILGDRIRMSEHSDDKKVFVRSLASRGQQGGLSASIYMMSRALEHFDFDIVIVETVGVGQAEVEVMNVVDCVCVVVVPESGDSIQAMKAGVFEISNVFVVNKSDRPGSEQMVKELESILNGKIFSTEALTGKGVDSLANFLISASEKPEWKKARNSPRRLQAEAAALYEEKVRKDIIKKISKIKKPKDLSRI